MDDIVERCRTAVGEHTPQLAIRDVVAEIVHTPGALAAAIGPITEGGIRPLHRSSELTVLHIAWTPGMQLNPHDHGMFAVVGMYGGQEDNSYYRRAPRGLEATGGRSLVAGDVLVLGEDAIHAVANPKREYAVAIHVYGGDFFATPRSEWRGAPPTEEPFDVDRLLASFAAANEKLGSL